MSGVSRETGSPAAETPPEGVSRETEGAGNEGATPDAGDPAARPRPRLSVRIALAPIHGYQRWISPLLGQRCRYYPSCSAYAEEAVRELGPLRGFIVAAWRVLRCNPLTPGGLDPLENRRLFRSYPRSGGPRRGGIHV
jgi:putative membrane protein insertion efficiency factor